MAMSYLSMSFVRASLSPSVRAAAVDAVMISTVVLILARVWVRIDAPINVMMKKNSMMNTIEDSMTYIPEGACSTTFLLEVKYISRARATNFMRAM